MLFFVLFLVSADLPPPVPCSVDFCVVPATIVPAAPVSSSAG